MNLTHNQLLRVFMSLAILIGIIGIALAVRTASSTSDCGTLPANERGLCCAADNKDSITVSCVGEWQWDSRANECSFVCKLEEEPMFCTQEAKECSDGSFVSRDPQNGCEFRPCP